MLLWTDTPEDLSHFHTMSLNNQLHLVPNLTSAQVWRWFLMALLRSKREHPQSPSLPLQVWLCWSFCIPEVSTKFVLLELKAWLEELPNKNGKLENFQNLKQVLLLKTTLIDVLNKTIQRCQMWDANSIHINKCKLTSHYCIRN